MLFRSPGEDFTVLVLANFSDVQAEVSAGTLSGMPDRATDLDNGHVVTLSGGVTLGAHRFLWLRVG